jgi:hypothetical protein
MPHTSPPSPAHVLPTFFEMLVAFVGFASIYGDRLFAFRSAARPTGFPYLTGREQLPAA